MIKIKKSLVITVVIMILVVILLNISTTIYSDLSKDDSGKNTPVVETKVIAVDPYIEGAKFFEDVDNDGQKDSNEQESSLSDSKGNFTFSRPLQKGSIIRLSDTVTGTHNGVAYKCAITRRVDVITETLVISPLTTLLANDWTEIQIVKALSNAGLAGLTVEDLEKDPMAGIANYGAQTLTEAHLTKLKAAISIYSFLSIMDALNNGKGYDITYITFTANATTTTLVLQNMVTVVNNILSPVVLTQMQKGMNGAKLPEGLRLPKATASDIIRTSVAIVNYIIPQVAVNPTTYTPDLEKINTLLPTLAQNFYLIRNKTNQVIQIGASNGFIPGAMTDVLRFHTLVVNSSGVVEGR
jgi:hypothetical protein